MISKEIVARERHCNHLKAERESEVSTYYGVGLLMFGFLIMSIIWFMMG